MLRTNAVRLLIVLSWLVSMTGTVALARDNDEARQRWRALGAEVVELYQAGHYDQTAAQAEEALNLVRSSFGERGPDTLTSLHNLASLYCSQGRYGEAEPLYSHALQLRREVRGESHPDTLGAQLNSAVQLAGGGKIAQAEAQLRQMEPQRRT